MSTIQRSVYINNIEPQLVSLRAPSEMETRLETTFFNQNGSVYSQDMACQLHLTSKSDNHTTIYAMPSIDVVNGKVRAVIPQGDLTDMNGYRLRILGTYQQQPLLLAIGNLHLVGSAGMKAFPDDIVDTIALSFVRGVDDYVDVKLWHDAAKTNPYDIASLTVTAPITNAAGGASLTSFTVAQIGYNEVRLSLTATQTTALPASCWWTLVVSSGAGQQTMAQGPVTITG